MNIPEQNSLDSLEGLDEQSAELGPIISEDEKAEDNPQVESLKKDFFERGKRVVEQTHQYDPAYIFLTETSSISSGYMIKEGLKIAYPEDPLPKFYRINPTEVMELMLKGQHVVDGEEDRDDDFETKRKELEDFFKKRIKDREARILIYDVDWSKGPSPGSILSLLKNPKRYGFSEDIKCDNVKMNLSENEESHQMPGFPHRDGYYLNTGWNPNNLPILDLPVTKEDIVPISGHSAPLSSHPIMITGKRSGRYRWNNAGEHNFRAKIVSENQKQREPGDRAHTKQLEYIKALKIVGKMIGKEIRENSKNET